MDKQRQVPGDGMPHGLVFHYLHDGGAHAAGQGSISGLQFEKIIDRYLAAEELLSAKEWARRAEAGGLNPDDVCVTFDDALRSQFDIALPVLRRKGLTAFWFVQSSILTGEAGLLEAFRRFRNEYFPSVQDFYQSFYSRLLASGTDAIVRRMGVAMPDDFLHEFQFYTAEDRWFRYVRDKVLQPREYVDVMKDLMRSMDTSVEDLSHDLMLDRGCLKTLESEGHIVGLHSHSHPTCISDLPKDAQRSEYQTNYEVLSEILVEPPFTMAHPCNSYSADTLEILRSLGIRIGFRSNMAQQAGSALEYPRKDSADLLNKVSA